jgi:hypothetical protein
MNWHTVTVAEGDLDQLLLTIRRAGGSITHSFPAANGYTVIYTTLEG